jgi:2,3-bisphosphoglycerate-independent phosphoglycerate mutase
MDFDIIKKLSVESESKVVLLIMDGLGGVPAGPQKKTELEAAVTPNLDKLAKESICGLHQPIGSGITPGSGPAHLSVFGYDPIKHQIGRGVLEALGINFELGDGDVAARGNFCTVDGEGKITDRRAGRIPTDESKVLCEMLNKIELEGAEVFVKPVKEHRLLLVLRGEGLSGDLEDTDPQRVGKKPLEPKAITAKAEKTAELVKGFMDQAQKILADQSPANMLTLRGFASRPTWPTVGEIFGVRTAAVAAYPMYKGVAKLVGMDVLDTGSELEDEFDTLEQRWNDYDFFYFHVKPTDSAGEDGDYDRKVSIIERVDKQIPRLMALNPGGIIVTGDHSTPSALKSHSWHPVPVLVWGKHCRPDSVTEFGENACVSGALGPIIPGSELLTIAMANAGRLEKFGA